MLMKKSKISTNFNLIIIQILFQIMKLIIKARDLLYIKLYLHR